MTNKSEEPADITARLGEEELLKPGTEIKPGSGTINQPGAPQQPSQPGNLEKDVVEFNKFAAAQEEVVEETEKPGKGALHVVWEVVKTLLIAGAVVVIINTFVFQAYYVSGNSMNPDYHDGDYLLVNKIPGTFRNIAAIFNKNANMDLKRGDVLVFIPPENPSIFYIKRVIGLPGDRVVLKDGKFTIYNQQYPNGLTLDENYIDPDYKTEGEVDQVVLPGNVFVVGDNRSPGGSYDSRAWGQLSQGKISGVAFFRLLPISDIGFISGIDYQNKN